MTRDEQILASFLTSLDSWIAQLEEARRSPEQERALDHFEVTLCQASQSLRQLLARQREKP